MGESHLPSGSPDLIVKELQNQLIEDAVKEYSEDDAYWCGYSVCLIGMKFLIDINLKLYDNQYQS